MVIGGSNGDRKIGNRRSPRAGFLLATAHSSVRVTAKSAVKLPTPRGKKGSALKMVFEILIGEAVRV